MIFEECLSARSYDVGEMNDGMCVCLWPKDSLIGTDFLSNSRERHYRVPSKV
jgi:hypothetical protein